MGWGWGFASWAGRGVGGPWLGWMLLLFAALAVWAFARGRVGLTGHGGMTGHAHGGHGCGHSMGPVELRETMEPEGDRAVALLRERLARGEIDEEEFRRRLAVLRER